VHKLSEVLFCFQTNSKNQWIFVYLFFSEFPVSGRSWIQTIYMWFSIDEESALGCECWLGVVYVWIYWWDSFSGKEYF
jgi:hypothetical protein